MVWYGMVWYGMVWYGMVWYGMVWYGMVWYGMVWYGMVWYGMVWYGMVWVWYGMVWYALRYWERLAGRSLTLPVFRAGVRGQLAVTLGCCPPGFGGGGGGAVAALSPSTCPSPRAPASCAGKHMGDGRNVVDLQPPLRVDSDPYPIPRFSLWAP